MEYLLPALYSISAKAIDTELRTPGIKIAEGSLSHFFFDWKGEFDVNIYDHLWGIDFISMGLSLTCVEVKGASNTILTKGELNVISSR